MTNLTRDPKGYYIALGIAEDADGDAIKAAYRSKAKRLHPDFNPSPIAAKQFHRLHEAYDTLSDPEKRAAYDRPWKTAQKQEKKPQPKAGPKTERAPERRAETPAGPAAPSRSVEEPALCRCGKVTAQPRYVIFDVVWGRLRKVQKTSVSGIFCRTCADRAAVKASLLTWLLGWWAWPNGPKETVKALVSNIRGGRKPVDRNARLLLRQARAFQSRGEPDLARSAGEQALTFAKLTNLRGEVEQFLLTMGDAPRVIKDRWSKAGWAPMVQVLPLAIIIAAISTFITYSTPVPLTQMARNFYVRLVTPSQHEPVTDETPVGSSTSGRVYSVTRESAALRTGPAATYQLEALLKTGTLVLATETAPDGAWLRIVTADRTTGFIAASDVTADIPAEALSEIDRFGGVIPAKTN